MKYLIIFLLSAFAASQAHSCEKSQHAVPLVNASEVLQLNQKPSLRQRIPKDQIDAKSTAFVQEDAKRSGLSVEFMYAISIGENPGYYLVFSNLKRDDSYLAYHVVPSQQLPLYKFEFHYMLMPEPRR